MHKCWRGLGLWAVAGILASFSGLNPPKAAGNFSYDIAPWYQHKSAALSLTFDDNETGQWDLAIPRLNALNLQATFFLVTNWPRIDWNLFQSLDSLGHEFASHTLSHPRALDIPLNEFIAEAQAARDTINARLPQSLCTTFAYPFGQGSGDSPKEDSIRQMIRTHFIGARGTSATLPTYDEIGTGDYAFRSAGYLMRNTTTLEDVRTQLAETKNSGSWLSLVYHGIADENPGSFDVLTSDFDQHLDAIQADSAVVWVAPYRDVLMYYQERASATLSLIEETDSHFLLRLTDTLPDSIYQHPLTINFRPESPVSVDSVLQQGRSIPFVQGDATIRFEAVPDAGPIRLVKMKTTPFSDPIKNASFSLTPLQMEQRSTQMHFNLTLPQAMNIQLTLYDARGKQCRTFHAFISTQQQMISLNIQELTPGIYHARLTAGGHQQTQKFQIP